MEATTHKIVLIGSAGQGIKLIGEMLGNILAKLQKEVSLNVVYPPTVRTGSIEAELIYSDSKIEVPFIDEADLILQLAKSENNIYKTKEMIIEESIFGVLSQDLQLNGVEKELVSFEKISAEIFGSPLFLNMLALGKLLDRLGIDLEKVDLESLLPSRNRSRNLEAIRHGYSHHAE